MISKVKFTDFVKRATSPKMLLSFLALSFDFLDFIHGSTIGFSVKNERLITVKKKVNFSCISTSSAVSATPYIFFLEKQVKIEKV